MTWNETQKLTWSDFKASPNADSDAVALTASGITFGYSVKTSRKRIIDFSTSVEAHIYLNKSWYLEAQGDDYILGHEQLHFDLTGLYARMFIEQLTRLVVNQNVKKQMKQLHITINEALDETQKRYDAQSQHSIKVTAQTQWQVYIKEELSKLDEFKS